MTMTIPPRPRAIEPAPSSALGAIPFPRLVRVEWAKATDTRAARWLLALVALSTAGMMLVPVLAPTTFDQTYASYLGVAGGALAILLPVVAILMFTGEWSQRSVFTTFTQGRIARSGVASVACCNAASLSDPLTRRCPSSLRCAFGNAFGIQCDIPG